MIISQTPLRMSFVGGGSDLASYYRQHGGAVVSTSIDQSVYITINRKFDEKIRVSYSKTEEVASVGDLSHKLFRACLERFGITGGVEITSIADVPSQGSGLGSSSSFTVGLLHVLHAYNGQYVSQEELAAEACNIEIDICGEPIGKQDQYAAACGGFNYIRFNKDDTVDVEPIFCEGNVLQELENSLLMFYTGITRSAAGILSEQTKMLRDDNAVKAGMAKMVQFAADLRDELFRGNLGAFGEILHAAWELKKTMAAGISNQQLDEWYSRARAAGAIGGKLLGAGGGGFMLFLVSKDKQQDVAFALRGLHPVKVKFRRRGSQIVFFHQ